MLDNLAVSIDCADKDLLSAGPGVVPALVSAASLHHRPPSALTCTVFVAMSNEGGVMQMDKRLPPPVDEAADVLRLGRTTYGLKMTKRIPSQRRTASARGVVGARTPPDADVGRDSIKDRIPSHSGKIS
jgi:hypothetical protein